MDVYFLHGIVDDWTPRLSAHRNYVPRQDFESYLRERSAPFLAWQADNRGGDVLTVDDATRAAADACLLARQLGHEVIFFVNALQVASGEPYFFSLLDNVIDARNVDTVDYQGESFDLTVADQLRRFRQAATSMLVANNSTDTLDVFAEIRALLGATGPELLEFQAPIGLTELSRLRDAGVRIENHGWSHADISELDDQAFANHVVDGREWLRGNLGVDASLYAVPFGLCDVRAHLQPLVGDAYFLADAKLPPRRVAPRCWNRRDITSRLQAMRLLDLLHDRRRDERGLS